MWQALGTENNNIELVPHSKKWKTVFELESSRIRQICPMPVALEHVGSTSIPGIKAKPVIDVMLGFQSLKDGEQLIEPLTSLGYAYFGPNGIEGRQFFVLKHKNRSVVHLHGFIINSEHWQRHLFFKQFLIDNPGEKKKYQKLKEKLAKAFKHDRKRYSSGKNAYIKSIEGRLKLNGQISDSTRSNAMIVRKYRHIDRSALLSLWNRVFPDHAPHNSPSKVIDLKQAVDDMIFVAESDGKVIGSCLAGYDGHRGWLYAVAVYPDYRHHGVGTRLVRTAVDALKDIGCVKVNIQVRADNQEIVGFYTSLGFLTEERISMGLVVNDTIKA